MKGGSMYYDKHGKRKETPQDRYNKKNTTLCQIRLNYKTDADILTWLDSQPNKTGYIKALIRADIAKRG